MMDKELEAEIHPLKADERKSQGNVESRTEKDGSFKKTSHRSRFAQCRTVVFFFSLFICLFVVFIISFIIPCPDQSISQKMWKINYNAAVTYDFMTFKDISEDTIQDIVFLYKDGSSDGSSNSNKSCTYQGFSAPCAFLAALSGTNGSLLWERPVAQDVVYMECVDRPMIEGPPSVCFIIGKQHSFLAVDSSIGEIIWNQPWPFGDNDSILTPFLTIPDVTGNEIQDLLIFTKSDRRIKTYLFSSNTGDQVGSLSYLNLEGEVGYLMHITYTGAYYILFHSASYIYAYSLKDLYEEMTGGKEIFVEDTYWQKMIDNVTHRILPFSSGTIRYLINVPVFKKKDILLVKTDRCELFDGQMFSLQWTLNASEVVRKPVLGYYKPGEHAIVLEAGTGFQRKILIVDAPSGDILWSLTLNSFPGIPKITSVSTADQRSAFFFWDSRNQTETGDYQKTLYMFHPILPYVLLELTKTTKNIVAFNVIFEQKHHASYVLLTGPTGADPPGQVSLSKEKLKESVLNAKVIWLGQMRPENDQAIKDVFYDLRYKRET
ncbi:protein FAM234A [Antechinus flavipes]|uniref:protein FAM234A n=1 Tax=Antechinus flavipes TaxID=38775 RepID=UPI002235A17D|nr:protein FAM234A [Antechinus flavipes]XP_051824560.1 protein FAM234A [Antechinus flavipes]XP_051824566.1 protein FAM234A [Antechinus flavipes]